MGLQRTGLQCQRLLNVKSEATSDEAVRAFLCVHVRTPTEVDTRCLSLSLCT